MTEASLFNSTYNEEIYRISSKTVIVLPCPWSEVGDEYRLPLSKILHALGLSLESVTIILQAPFDLSAMVGIPKRIIAFVSPPKGLSFYELHVIGETSVIFADGLGVLNQDEASKRKFWNALQTLFAS